MTEQRKQVPAQKAAYEPPALRRVGTFGDVMQGGSMMMGEPGPGMRRGMMGPF